VARRWLFTVASAVIVLMMVIAFTLDAAKGPPVLRTCGADSLPNGNCVGLPGPGEPGATCVPQPDGPYAPCSWFWKSPYPEH
jgi:hypothetical protein